MLTIKEFAALFRVSENTAHRVCDAGAPSVRILSARRVDGEFVQAALRAMRCGPVDLIEFARNWSKQAVA